MAEWLKAPVLKTGVSERVPEVRILPLPQIMMKKLTLIAIMLLVALGGSLAIIKERKDGAEKTTDTKSNMRIETSILEANSKISAKYTCDGDDISPPLTISDVPPEAKSLALIVDDPDSPTGNWTHWTIWNMDPALTEIEEDTIPEGIEGITSFGSKGYGGPCPGSGVHRYYFKLYALDTILDIPESTDKKSLETAMVNHILASAELVGLYSRK